MSRRNHENTPFCCLRCGRSVPILTNGSYRNHCPFCLTSVHIDLQPGDRASSCLGLMTAISLKKAKKGWQIVHRCDLCGTEKLNLIAEGTECPDDVLQLGRLLGGAGRRR